MKHHDSEKAPLLLPINESVEQNMNTLTMEDVAMTWKVAATLWFSLPFLLLALCFTALEALRFLSAGRD
jgi:hypothetical protein